MKDNILPARNEKDVNLYVKLQLYAVHIHAPLYACLPRYACPCKDAYIHIHINAYTPLSAVICMYYLPKYTYPCKLQRYIHAH